MESVTVARVGAMVVWEEDLEGTGEAGEGEAAVLAEGMVTVVAEGMVMVGAVMAKAVVGMAEGLVVDCVWVLDVVESQICW